MRRKGAHNEGACPALSEGTTVDESPDDWTKARRPSIQEGEFHSRTWDVVEASLGEVDGLSRRRGKDGGFWSDETDPNIPTRTTGRGPDE